MLKNLPSDLELVQNCMSSGIRPIVGVMCMFTTVVGCDDIVPVG